MNKITIISTILLLFGIINFPSYAESKGTNTNATATLSPSCRIKVLPMSFGDVSMQSMSGNGDIFATTTLSLLCTKNQSATFTSNLGVNSNGGSWVFGTNYVCQTDVYGSWINDGDQTSCYNYLYPRKGGQIDSVPVYYPYGQKYNIRFANVDGSAIAVNQSPTPTISNLVSGANKISYTISTNNTTYTPINATASNSLTYTQNNGDWQDYPLYGKANVKQAAPGIYLDTNTITVNF